MALHSKKEFARLCGIPSNRLSIYIARGKVRLSGDYIDDSVLENSLFLEKAAGSRKPEMVIEHSENEDLPSPNIRPIKEGESVESGYALDKKLKQTKIEKTEEEIAILKIRKEKQLGEVIPTDLVKSIFIQHSQSIVTEFKNCIDDILTTFAKTKDLNTNEIAEIRGGLVKNINVSVDKAVNLTKKNINNIIKDFTVKREVGERQ